MSYLPCSYCGDFADTDGDGEWNVQKINSPKRYEFVCGCCCEKYLTEDGHLDPDLEDGGMQISEAQRHMEEGP